MSADNFYRDRSILVIARKKADQKARLRDPRRKVAVQSGSRRNARLTDGGTKASDNRTAKASKEKES